MHPQKEDLYAPAPPAAVATMADRLRAAAEIALATDLPGTLLLQIGLLALGFKSQDLMHSSRWLVVFVLCNSFLVLGMIALLLKARNESWRVLFGTPRSWRHEVAVALLLVPALFLATIMVAVFFRQFLPQMVTKENRLLALIQTPADVAFFLLVSIVAGGIKEEVQRAFVLRRFEKYLGGIFLGLAVWSVYFGIGHAPMQGFDNAVGAGVLGLIFGLIYIWRQNLITPIVLHAVYDATVIIVYWRGLLGRS
ncbi:MAG TPA: type II CAAX endopeptidase family protein [Acidobacteriota bacterium]|jgi:membrane protease YdiL (CAAX protease family)